VAGGLAYWSVYLMVFILGARVSDPESLRSQIVFLSFGQFAQATASIYFGTWLASPRKRRLVAWALGILEGALFALLIILITIMADWNEWRELIRGAAGLFGVAYGIKLSRDLKNERNYNQSGDDNSE